MGEKRTIGLTGDIMAAELIFEDVEKKPLFGGRETTIGLDVPESAQARISEAEQFGTLPSFGQAARTPETTLQTQPTKVKRFADEGTLTAKQADQFKGAATGAATGLQLGSLPTGQTEFASADTAIQVLGGIGTGFAVGGPWGAVAGGLAAGLGAFLTTRGTKRAEKELAAKEARYQKAVEQQLARENKFRTQERFDKLEEVGYNRRNEKFKNQQIAYQDFNNQIMTAINNNASLKQRFAKSGF